MSSLLIPNFFYLSLRDQVPDIENKKMFLCDISDLTKNKHVMMDMVWMTDCLIDQNFNWCGVNELLNYV
jgi:hypothetical protein